MTAAIRKGAWFISACDGDCHGCGREFGEGDEIRADGDGGFEARRCCGNDARWLMVVAQNGRER